MPTVSDSRGTKLCVRMSMLRLAVASPRIHRLRPGTCTCVPPPACQYVLAADGDTCRVSAATPKICVDRVRLKKSCVDASCWVYDASAFARSTFSRRAYRVKVVSVPALACHSADQAPVSLSESRPLRIGREI